MPKRNILKAVTFIFVALCFFVGAKLLYSNVFYAWNKGQLKDLTARSISRTEYAADLAITTMMDIQVQGLTNCTSETIEAYKKYILSTGSIKNIYLATAGTSCFGFNTNDILTNQNSQRHWISGRVSNIQFSILPNEKKGSLGIKWKLDDFDLMAVISVGGLLFDMVPSALRTHLGINILLSNGKEITSYRPDVDTRASQIINPADQLVYKASSDRYPIMASLTISRAALWDLGGNHGKVFDFFVGLTGLIIGYLVIRVLFPPLGIIGELDEAIGNGEIHPQFQPIVSLNSHRIVGFEMLARWTKPSGKIISPSHFIPLAENLGRIDAILFSLLRCAGKKIGNELHKNPNLKLTFNIAPEQFLDPTFLRRLLDVIVEVELPAANLVAEITERQELADLELAKNIVTQYNEIDIRIAIDDVGTGHSGLSSIHKLNARILKLDKIFIDGIVYDERSRQMVAMLSQLANQYQMTIVAEGIETAEQAATALALGIQEGQGFYFSRPVSAEKLVTLLNRERRERQDDLKPVPEGNTEELLAANLG